MDFIVFLALFGLAILLFVILPNWYWIWRHEEPDWELPRDEIFVSQSEVSKTPTNPFLDVPNEEIE